MPKVLRLHNNGSQQVQGWQKTAPVTSTEINTVTDPAGGKSRNLAVSIPTPFARMHLFETAFDFLAREGKSNPGSVYHELTTHFWDLLELLYNYHLYTQAGRKITLRRWNAEAEIQRMRQSESTRLLGETLKLYMQDERFRDFSDMYLVYYESPELTGGPRLLGGTSPLTMLFTGPGVGALDLERPQARGHYFDHQTVLLDDRDPQFREFVYELFLAYPALQRREFAGSVYAGLDRTKINQLQMQGDRSAQQFATRYPALADAQGNLVSVKGVPLPGRADQSAVTSSDLFIQPTREAGNGRPRPLVLRPNLTMPGANYLNGQPWDDRTPVPYHDELALENRVLPGKGFKYPYITVGDLLEDSLVELPYELNTQRFHTGKVTFQYGADGQGRARFPYLLPLKQAFFEYFTENELAELLTFTIDLSHVRVQLQVPVQGGRFITFERSYYTNPQNPKDAQGREIPEKGRIVKANVGVGVFPFYKVRHQPEFNDLYKVMLVDADNSPTMLSRRYDLTFFVNGERITEQGAARRATRYERTQKSVASAGSTYYEITGTHFDLAEITCPPATLGAEPARGLFVPRWRELERGTRRFTFAIDFGTTNTHVAYADSPSAHPRPLTIGEADVQVEWLSAPLADAGQSASQRYRFGAGQLNSDVATLQNREFVPSFIGEGGSVYEFPIRTAVCETTSFANEPAKALSNINIGFSINTETTAELPQNRFVTNLKWSAELDPQGVSRIEAFFKEILLLLRHKAALHGGILEDTRVVWFAPLSFDGFLRNQFQQVWDEAFQQVFKAKRPTICLTESVAPYYYLTATNQVVPNRDENVVNIDIGGGTTDLLLFADQKPAYSTSFRFAGDDLWGDGYARVQGAPKQNGLLRLGVSHVESLPDSEQNQEYKGYLQAALKNSDFGSADVTSLLFKYDDALRFTQALGLGRGRQLRVLFYLHYTAIIYHTAQLTKHFGLKTPRYLCFSGKGSLYLRLLAGGSSLVSIEKITKAIFQAVTGTEPPHNFRVILADNPKEATTNGGVLFEEKTNTDYDNIQAVKLSGTVEGGELNQQRLKLNQVDAALKDEVLANVRNYLTLVLEGDEVAPYLREVGVDVDRQRVKDILLREIEDSLSLGLHQFQRQLSADETLPETLFFLPLKQALYNLSRELQA
ncbi:hypothetical protein [Hymenobacter terrestris]|uniref:Baseplate protein J-like domain-containing protein n=1 Tax=Hymenobacter terrestris TaxID=2748310 RepID=A0ABX2Q434_9BACT|nr:hypothetical protein [Hymenobacter terrestris]NVO84781.1 hypothetical protein [Hymenobacter terrestris]